jgi:phytoene dehydrogenase-like protein
MLKYDIIVIGGGLGGLTAGAKLAKEGKKVLLLEQHDRPGGCATTFRRKDFTLEVGLHEMDGLHPRDLKTKIFRDLGLFERVEFLPVPEFYRFIQGETSIVISHDPEEVKATLLNHFPGEKAGIDLYFESVLNARKIIGAKDSPPDKTVGEWLDEIISDETLKLVLLGNLGYFHDDPYSLSYYYYITAQGSYYNGRANYIKGGSQLLSDALVDIITENGGSVLLNTLAEAIVYNKDNTTSVRYCTKTRGAIGKEIAAADRLVVNTSVHQLVNKLLPEGSLPELVNDIEQLNIGASLLTVYYGFRKSLKSLGNKHYSLFVYDESVKSQADILKNNHSDFDTRSFTFVDYSQVDSALAPEGKSVGAVCCVDYLDDWSNLDKKEYAARKNKVADTFTRRLDNIIPGFAEAVEYVEVATSRTVQRYTMNPGGAVYGFAQNPSKSAGYLEKLPDNIFLASAWGKFGGGFSGAIFSGYMTAFDILRKG